LIISPLAGEILATESADREEVVSAEIDLDEVLDPRKRIPFWRDRRPEAYRTLIDPPGDS
jgi:predicted amidohydrolase